MIKLNYSNIKWSILAVAILTLLILPAQLFSQSASLSGTVQDTSKGYLPGVTITAVNVDTGVETVTLANDTGAFNFPSLQPGTYEVSAALDGFKKSTKTDVSLGGSAQMRLNFELEVAGLAQEIEVTTTAQDILTESSSSTGTVLRSQSLIELPLTSNDVMELVNIMGGVQASQNEGFASSLGGEYDSLRNDQSFAGVSADAIHIEQDGITINDVRYNTGIASSSRINTEMVSEFKLVLSPVDAEMGRGMGQVQILTKSGANAYHGSGVWNITNTALDANTWNNNRTGQELEWRNLNTYTLSFSGPIRKNKTFFFLTWDHAIPRTHNNRQPQVLTNCARKGIFRFFDGYNAGHYDSTVTGVGTSVVKIPAVDYNGFPLDQNLADSMGYAFVGLRPAEQHDPDTGAPIYENGAQIVEPIGELQFESVFGPLTDQARALVEQDLVDCSQYTPDYAAYDMANPTTPASYSAIGISRYWEEGYYDDGAVYRRLDTTAIPNFTDVMPKATTFRFDPDGSASRTDGLNFATHSWTRADKGVDRIYGVGNENARKNITVKIDHNFSDRHRASGTYTYERDVNAGAQRYWPNGYEGTTERFPQRFSISLTSSIKPTLLNEARFGLNRNLAHSLNAIDATATKDEVQSLMQSMLPTCEWENYLPCEPFYFNPLRFWSNNYNSHFIGGADRGFWHAFLPSWGGFDHTWTMSDTLTWTKGRHSLKFGGEIRLTRSHQDANGDISDGFMLSRPSLPLAFGGIVAGSEPDDLAVNVADPQIPGLVGNTSYSSFFGPRSNGSTGSMREMMELRDYHAGSMSHIWQWYFINDPFDKDWNDINTGEINRISDIRYKEMAFFAKDDWKVTNSLTLNLGLRYEYYGVPWMDRGMSLALSGGSDALFGITGRDFTTWMAAHPVDLGDDYIMQQEFIGPGSPQPDVSVFYKDLNNFGPAVGFAWQLPWFGKGKTTLRGGYQLSYAQIANANSMSGGFSDLLSGSVGTQFNYFFVAGENYDLPYMRFADLDSYLPSRKWLGADEPQPLAPLDVKNRESDLSVYDQNIVNPYTQSLNVSISRQLGSQVTLDVRYIGTLARKGVSSLNLNSANWLNNGLKEAFDAARAGGTNNLLDHFFEGVQINDTDLGAKNRMMCCSDPGPNGGEVLRALYNVQLSEGDYNAIAGALNTLNYQKFFGMNASLPALGALEDGSVMRHANTLYPGDFPENFIVANPQLGAANWYTNLNHNNYHSMQVRFEVRPTRDFNITTTYTWAKNLGNSNYTNPNDRTNPFDYTWTGNSRAHQLTSYGAWTLPFGANGFFFRDISNPIVRRFVEGWNLSWIFSVSSGNRSDISADATHLYGNSVPNIIRPDLFNPKDGHVTWEPGASNGWYWGDPDKYMMGPDLQCFDTSLVYYDYTINAGEEVETANSLRGDCIDNMSAMYIPMYEENDDGELVPVYSPENVIFQNPLPGEYGSFGRNKIEGPGSFSLDMALGKTVQLTEGKSIQFRVDGSNILNHPSPGGGSTSITQTGNGLGYIGNKTGSRRFQAKLTIRF